MLIEVGKPLIPGKTDWPERAEYNFRGGSHRLVISYSNLKPVEIQAVARHVGEFALAVQNGLIFFMFNFGVFMPWSDAPYTWWLIPEDEREPPPPLPTENTRLLLDIVLVEAPLGIVRALRAVTLSPEFTRLLFAAIQDDINRGSMWPDYDDRLKAVYAHFPTPKELQMAALVRCKGGA